MEACHSVRWGSRRPEVLSSTTPRDERRTSCPDVALPGCAPGRRAWPVAPPPSAPQAAQGPRRGCARAWRPGGSNHRRSVRSQPPLTYIPCRIPNVSCSWAQAHGACASGVLALPGASWHPGRRAAASRAAALGAEQAAVHGGAATACAEHELARAPCLMPPGAWPAARHPCLARSAAGRCMHATAARWAPAARRPQG
jgi:hypothetical protein